MRVTVLGAGYMGTAMAEVAAMGGHDVRLWGTWLDDAMIEAVEQRREHPRLKMVVDARIVPMRSGALAEALAGAELVIHGVSSDGAMAVMEKAGPHIPDVPVLSVTKGFLPSRSGAMDRIDVVLSEIAGRKLRFVHAAGPAKAIEIARRVLTLMCFAGERLEDARTCAAVMGAPHMQIATSDDIAGAEICSAMKNAYATGLGLWDGMVGADCHNARAACFTQGIVEMEALVKAGGGLRETVQRAAGVGDLHVTAAAGRNRAFGERVGKGTPAKQVAAEMLAAGQLTEGYAAIASAWRWAQEHGVRDLPFLKALNAIVWEGAEVAPTLASLKLTV
ncbi:Glycerol-3-phosphate dehydrogenase [Labilithrix luteola]|uniref:Glycerol-3-phosphate dehydrogenase n=1 Tax=Labilithrix luteola TaxID=1391654 RepID=A0A0K1Q6C8_9BACT|nr:NAD(P)H-dependent glycerol-3-phosphate dehydrogenase [Labilithrix luteola]AKV01283.1 Glycerol-3-phosphate dehydrogenase [Labilithrix luteola]